jgi:hypothetical protein
MTATAPEIRHWKTDDELTREELRARRAALRGGRALPACATDEWRAHIDELVASIAERRGAALTALAAAERDLGVAVVDGTAAPAARKRVADARSELEALAAAETEIKQRDEEEARRHSAAEYKARRVAAYQWMAAHLANAEAVLRAREALIAAENELRALGSNALLVSIELGAVIADEISMDAELVAYVRREPDTDTMGVTEPRYANFVNVGGLTPDRCVVLREKAQRLAAAEQTP